jgi:hypothetical protein
VLAATNRTSQVLAAVTAVFGVAAAVTGWRGWPSLSIEEKMRRSGVMGIGTGLLLLNGAILSLSNPNRAGRALGRLVLAGGVVSMVVGG